MLSPVVQVKVLPCYSLFFPQETPGMHDKASPELLNLSCTVKIQGFSSFYKAQNVSSVHFQNNKPYDYSGVIHGIRIFSDE